MSLGLLSCVAPAAAQQRSLEQAVKASYLLKFAPFVEWPAQTFAASNSPFVICLAGEDPFGALMDDAVRGQKISGRPIALRRLAGELPAGGCQILFMGRQVHEDAAVPLDVAGQPMLTITDKNSGVAGGMIKFVMNSGRVRFEINEGAARASGLTISSKLLGLALTVDRR